MALIFFSFEDMRTTPFDDIFPVNIYQFQVNNRITRRRYEIYSKLIIKTPQHSGVYIVNFEHISHPFLMFTCLTLNK